METWSSKRFRCLNQKRLWVLKKGDSTFKPTDFSVLIKWKKINASVIKELQSVEAQTGAK